MLAINSVLIRAWRAENWSCKTRTEDMDRCLEGEHIENFRLGIAGSVPTRYHREGVAIIIESIATIVRDENRWSFCVNHHLFNCT